MKNSYFASLAIVLLGYLLGSSSGAGELVVLSGSSIESETYHVDTSYECSHRFNGTFNKGDSKKIIDARPSILCLDSPGGSFVEALKVTSFMKSESIATRIEDGSRCESACALVFMAGSFHPHESEVAFAWRILHARGKLGFHAPALVVKEGFYDEKTIQKAYQLALKSVSKLVFDLVHRPGFNGSAIRTSLLGEMLATPSNSMLYVKTVDQAGRWGITVSGIKVVKSPDKNQLAAVCGNSFYWDDDQSAISKFTPSSNFWLKDGKQSSGRLKGTVVMSDMTGSGCKFEVKKKYVSMRISDDGRDSYSVVNPLMYYNASLKLIDLPLADFRSGKPGIVSGRCIIIMGGKETRNEQCQETQTRDNGKLTRTYSNSFGAQVLIQSENASTFYNGTKTSRPFQFDGKACVINPKQGTLFCFSAG